jgi:hypothetical protein
VSIVLFVFSTRNRSLAQSQIAATRRADCNDF